MAFPTIPTVAGGRVITGVQTGTSSTRTFPSLSGLTKDSGDLLIAIVWGYQSSLTSAIFSSWGAGFTEIRDIGVASQHCVGVAYKISDGTETGTFTVTQAGTVTGDAAFIVMSIPGAHSSTAPEVTAALATGTSSAANPASLDPSGWATEDTLWISTMANGETSTTGSFTGIGGPPSNFSDEAQTGISQDAVGGIEASCSFFQSAVSSVDAPAGTCDTSNARNGAMVIAVRPAPAAITLAPDPVVLDLAVAAPTLDLTLALTPTPVVLDFAVPGAVAEFPPIVLAPSPVLLDLSVTAPTMPMTLALTPTPVVLDLGIAAPTIGLGAVTLSPTPVVLDLSLTTPTLGLVLALLPAPVVLDLGVAGGDLQIGGAPIDLTPDPVVLDLSVVAPALGLVLDLVPTPVVLDLAVAASQVSLGSLVLAPTPVVLALRLTEPGQVGPIVIVSGSDHDIILESIAFFEAFDVADPVTQRQMLRKWLLEHGARRRLREGFWIIEGGLHPSRYL